jgi:AAA15 family ATPase/GTPase
MRHPAPETAEGQVEFLGEDESLGTQRFFSIAGPIIVALERGQVLAVDEIDDSLHPLLVRRLVELFHSPETNPHGAQLIMNTHDATMLDTRLFRRDQIWFTEKDSVGASRLYPLSDYSPRKDEALSKGYLHGRYGAVPALFDLGESLRQPKETAAASNGHRKARQDNAETMH